jgi:hypothetical protein
MPHNRGNFESMTDNSQRVYRQNCRGGKSSANANNRSFSGYLMENISICHQRAGADLEFGVVEFVPMKSGETKNVFMGSDGSVRELLKTFVRDERQLLGIWKNDIVEQVKEHLAEIHPDQDMSIVAGSFEIKLARAISEKPTLAQNHSRGVRI